MDRSSPDRWATFVANRTSQIQDITPPSIRRHVPTQDNPVDCASRGLFPSDLVEYLLWWNGPSFLKQSSHHWPVAPISQLQDVDDSFHSAEKKSAVILVALELSLLTLLDRFSSLNKIFRIISYCFRFTRSRSLVAQTKIIKAKKMSSALRALVFCVQLSAFSDEVSWLQNGLSCSKTLRQLDLFLDDNGIVRLGGRLDYADIPYAHKHSMLLPSRHRFTELVIVHHHKHLKHPGANSLQANLKQEFWILSVRKAICSRLRECIPCFRTWPRGVQPKLASLPSYRVQQIKPFTSSGVDL